MVNIRKGKIVSSDGKVAAYVDEKVIARLFVRQIVTSLVNWKLERCSSCKAYRVEPFIVDGASVVDVRAVTQAVTQMTGTYVRLN